MVPIKVPPLVLLYISSAQGGYHLSKTKKPCLRKSPISHIILIERYDKWAWERAGDADCKIPRIRRSSLTVPRSPHVAMPPTKPLNVEILRKDLESLADEDVWEEYQEYGVKAKSSTNSWSCYVLAKEGEVRAISV